MRLSRLLPLLAATVCAVPTQAQRLLVPHSSPGARIALVDASHGILVDGAWIDLAATAVPAPSPHAVRDVERVGDQIWVAGGVRVYRYDALSRTFLGSFDAGSTVRGLESHQGRVLVTLHDRVLFRAQNGLPLGELPIAGGDDTLRLQDGTLLVAMRSSSRVDRFSATGQFLGTFAGPSIPTPLGVLSHPQQLSLRHTSEGDTSVLVCGDVRVYEFALDGNFMREIDAGPFEGGVADTRCDRIFVSLGNGIAVHDPESGSTLTTGGPFFGTGRKVGVFDRGLPHEIGPGEASTQRVCDGDVNSDGVRARLAVIGSADVLDAALSVYVERLPARATVTLGLSRGLANTPVAGSFGGLCLDRDSLFLLGGPVLAGVDGIADFTLMRGDVVHVPVTVGSTFFAQALYRDESGPAVSDTLRVTVR